MVSRSTSTLNSFSDIYTLILSFRVILDNAEAEMYERSRLFALRGLIASMLFNVRPFERKQLVRAKPSFQGVLFLSPVHRNLLRACVAPDKYKKCCEEDNGWK